MREHYDSSDLVEVFKSLIGQKIVKIEGEPSNADSAILTTDKGVELDITSNEGCGGCSSGWSWIEFASDLIDSENAIVDVSIVEGRETDTYTISIFKENGKISKVLSDDGYGNGYYGGGFTVEVRMPNG